MNITTIPANTICAEYRRQEGNAMNNQKQNQNNNQNKNQNNENKQNKK